MPFMGCICTAPTHSSQISQHCRVQSTIQDGFRQGPGVLAEGENVYVGEFSLGSMIGKRGVPKLLLVDVSASVATAAARAGLHWRDEAGLCAA